MKNTILRDCVGLVGVVLLAIGAGMVYRPAGVIIGGAILILLALFGFKPEEKTGN